MAYTAGNLTIMGEGNGYAIYRYDSTDALATVDGDGYFNNSDDDLAMRVGDIVHVVVWDTVRTGLPSDYGIFMVLQVGSDGAVDLSNDMLDGTLATGD